MRIYRKVSVVLALTLFMAPSVAIGQSAAEVQQQLNTTNGSINDLRSKVNAADDAAQTLQGQLDAIDGQINGIKAQIASTTAKINDLNVQIAAVQARAAEKRVLLNEYLKESYYHNQTSTLEELMGANNLSEFVDKAQYLQAGQEKINALLADILAIKKDLDAKKADLGKLSDQLTQQQAGLDAQRAIQNDLLQKTLGEEAKYQQLLKEQEAAAERMRQTIYTLMGGGPMASRGHVVAGQVIGHEGSTGNSTGPHLHFSFYQNRQPVNPYNFTSNGRAFWPMSNFEVSQGFGCTYYSFEPYDSSCPGGHFHDGIDMVASYGAPVQAAMTGEIIVNSFQSGGFGHYIIIDHGNGLWSLYGHMQQ